MTLTARRHRATILAALLSLVVIVLAVLRVSDAGFSGSTTNQSTWSTGDVTLTDDDQGQAMFTAATDGRLDAGQDLTRCINVTYAGTLTGDRAVRLYGTATGALAPYLNLTVVEGTGAAQGSCTGFTPTSALYTGTLSGFTSLHDTFAHGASAWAVTTAPETRSYQFTVTVQDDNASQNKTGQATFTWEAADAPTGDPDNGTSIERAIRLDAPAAPGVSSTRIVDFATAAPYEQWEKDKDFPGSQDARIWLTFTPTVTGQMEVNTFPGTALADAACKTSLYPVVGTKPDATWMPFGTGGYGGYENGAGNTLDPDQTCDAQSRVIIKTTAGQPHRFFLAPGAASELTKKAVVRLRAVAPAPNDNVAAAATIPGLASGETRTIRLNPFGATSETGEPDATLDGQPAVTLWFRYIPLRTQSITFRNDEYSNGHTFVRAYTGGPAFNTMTKVFDQGTSEVGTATLTGGQTYYLQTISRDWQGPDYFTMTSSTVAEEYRAEVTKDNPGVYWGLGETSGNAQDALGRARTGTYAAGATRGATPLVDPAKGDGAVSWAAADSNLSGVSRPVESWMEPAANGTVGMSVEAWVRPTNLSGNGRYIAARDNEQRTYTNRLWMLMATSTGQVVAHWGNAGTGRETINTPDGTLKVNKTYHVVLTLDPVALKARIFVNGAIAAEAPLTGVRVSTSDNYALRVGSNDSTAADARNWIGTIDEFAFYPGKVLTPERVAAHYLAAKAG